MNCRAIIITLLWTLAFLLATNVGWSAWFAYCANPVKDWALMTDDDERMTKYDYGWQRIVQTRFTATRSTYIVSDRPDRPVRGWHCFPRTSPPLPVGDILPPWCCRRLQKTLQTEVSRTFGATGWPLPVLWCEMGWQENDLRVTPSTGFDTGMKHPAMQIARVLPFRPIWTGQLAYFAFWFVIVGTGRCIPSLWRTRHGCCTHCGYDLRANTTNTCPECGHPLHTSTTTAPRPRL